MWERLAFSSSNLGPRPSPRSSHEDPTLIEDAPCLWQSQADRGPLHIPKKPTELGIRFSSARWRLQTVEAIHRTSCTLQSDRHDFCTIAMRTTKIVLDAESGLSSPRSDLRPLIDIALRLTQCHVSWFHPHLQRSAQASIAYLQGPSECDRLRSVAKSKRRKRRPRTLGDVYSRHFSPSEHDRSGSILLTMSFPSHRLLGGRHM